MTSSPEPDQGRVPSREPSSYDQPYDDETGPYPDPTSSAELTPPTNRRQVVAGIAPPVSAILSWILAEARDNDLWYIILVVVTGLSAVLFASTGQAAERRRQR